MRLPLIVALAAIPAVAQTATVELTNISRPGSSDFQVGDRFQILITAPADQPVSVRTTMKGRMDWSPVIASTDNSGRWSLTGQFQKSDYGDWTEVWTVGRKQANPVVRFAVRPRCLKDGQHFVMASGPNVAELCDTAEGRQWFVTASNPDLFRTLDGRLVPGRQPSNLTAEQYHADVLQWLIVSRSSDGKSHLLGDEAGALIAKIIGVNALSDDETRNVLSIIHAAFEKPDSIPEDAKSPSATLQLLQSLADSAGPNLKQQIAETVAYVQAQ
jgi:hypothetical protein